MEEKILELELEKSKVSVSHILHLIATLLTVVHINISDLDIFEKLLISLSENYDVLPDEIKTILDDIEKATNGKS
mgnify:FL=1